MERTAVDEPTMSLLFTINTSPFLGKAETSSQAVTSVGLDAELQKLGFAVEATDSEDRWNVYGRKSFLDVSLRPCVAKATNSKSASLVLFKEVDGATHEPFEHLVIDVLEATAGKATELVMMRRAASGHGGQGDL